MELGIHGEVVSICWLRSGQSDLGVFFGAKIGGVG